MKRWGIILIVLTMFLIFLFPAYADQLDELKEQKEQIKQEIEKTKNNLNQEKEKEKSLSMKVKELADNVYEVEKQLNKVENDLSLAENKVEKAKLDLDNLEKELHNNLEVFKERLIDIYHNQDVNIIEVFTGSKNFTDFLVRIEMFKKIASHDMDMLEDIKEKKKEQENKKNELEHKRDQVLVLKENIVIKKKELEKRKNEQQNLLAAVRQQKDLILQALNEEEETSKRITQMISKLELEKNGISSRAPTKLAWPTPGYSRITSDYGWRTHPILKTRRWHTGIDIGVPWGEEVVAAEDGKVVLAEYYGAYGNTVIVLHGGNISTLYGHLSSIDVKKGDFVVRGQKVGEIGTTGLSTGPHLHYTVMKNGQDISPWKFY